ncbi:site-2 protease family protein, partial [Candidatus Bathyarchaeota archaeon]|nr:site-2 protease family protein [Candidatus Bathyarchaeota archaeon]NIU81594.1 site-2 protease family protein [Candidatus Bathyarchaeota archaeon]NIV68239.1 site-2 protease family protein [Candidatus Bathyarchaeota archaeon]NIW15987.1 site-2 protease family protein [Candidatus Bathyarchaeota archaeon]NIW34764.1 site-2 protease family protein [Candidatus Bathyarchaeota archaeon]
GSIGKKEAGKTALAGPLTNIVISSLCTSVLVVSENPSLWTIFSVGATINAMIAIFNLIPFGIMDGLKVFRWNKLIWAAAFGASVALTIYTFTL